MTNNYPDLKCGAEDVYSFMLIVYPTKRKSNSIVRKLGISKVKTFTSVFGNNNNKGIRDIFFSDEFV